MATVTGPLTQGTVVTAAAYASANSQQAAAITSATKGTAASGWYWVTAEVAQGLQIKTSNLAQETFSVTVKCTVKAPRAYTAYLENTSGTTIQTKTGSAGSTTLSFTGVTNKSTNVRVRVVLTGTSTSRNCGDYTATGTAVSTGTTTGATVTAGAVTIKFWIFKSGSGKTDVGTLATWTASGITYNTSGTSSMTMSFGALIDAQGAICFSGLTIPAGYTSMSITNSVTDTFKTSGGSYAAAGLPGRTLIIYGRSGSGAIGNVNNWTSGQGSSSWTSTDSSPASGSKTMTLTIGTGSSRGVAITSANAYGYQTFYCSNWYIT